MPHPESWTTYYRDHARPRLGPERRLSNGVAWRLLTDTVTNVAMPRITWMANRASLLKANALLDAAHGAEMLLAEDNRSRMKAANDLRREMSWPERDLTDLLVQTEVALTYAGPKAASLIEIGYPVPEAEIGPTFLHGLLLDLDRGELVHVERCLGRAPRFGFRYGELLYICNEAAHQQFFALVKAEAERAIAHPRGRVPRDLVPCLEPPNLPDFTEDDDYGLYLTTGGLAVHLPSLDETAVRRDCPMQRTPVNPVIVPYATLAPLMTPGALRDELLGEAGG